jgi:ATP-dependent helicase/DNAse subunit B
VSLRLLVGPARSGKIGVLAERFLASVRDGGEPVLVVPNVPEVDAVERELASRAGALFGGSVATFDTLASRILDRTGGAPRVPAEPLRALLLRRLAGRSGAGSLGRSARFAGFASALGRFADECAAAGVPPERLEQALDEAAAESAELQDVAPLYRAWRETLAGHAVLDRAARLAVAAERAANQLAAWGDQPLLVYGFEDLTRAQLDLVEAIAARAEVVVTLPYEPARAAFDALRLPFERLSARAEAVDELPPGTDHAEGSALRALERGLFSERLQPPSAPDPGVRFLEVAGPDGEAEALAAEVAGFLRAGTAPDDVLVVVPSAEGSRAALDRAFAALEVPASIDARLPLGRLPLGHAILSLCRFAWLGGDRDALFAWLRSPASGLARWRVDSWEGRLRGRGRREGAATYELLQELAGRPVDAVEALRGAEDPRAALRELLERAAPAAFGLDAHIRSEGPAALQVRAWRAALRTLDALASLREPPTPHELVAALETTLVRVGDDRPSGRVRVVSLRRARTHRAEVVLLAGLEEGRLPGRGRPDAFLSDEVRRILAKHRVPLDRRDHAARDRYLFYTAVTRASRRVVLIRQAVAEDGAPREPSPFWDEARRCLGDAAPPVVRRGLAELTYPLDSAPSERERLRALVALAPSEPLLAQRIAAAHGTTWARRLQRARGALARPTRLVDPELVAELQARRKFTATELESFLDCSQKWFVQRVLDPHDIDGQVDAKTRGSVAHAALHRFFTRLPATIGKDTLDAEDLPRVEALLEEVVAESLGAIRLPQDDLAVLELGRALLRDLRAFLRSETELEHRLVPRRLEVTFGGANAQPGLKEGLVLGDYAVSGRIDRIDADPLSARGLIQDYKYSTRADGADSIEKEQRLQLPLYLLALQELLGLEPVGGVYRALRGGGVARGILREADREDAAAGFNPKDYLSEAGFQEAIAHAVDRSGEVVRRIRRGDVRHDPRQGSCPAWCDVHPICRVRRA